MESSQRQRSRSSPAARLRQPPVRRLREQLRQRERELAAVHEVGRRLQALTEPTPGEVAAAAVDVLEGALGYQFSGIIVLDPASGRLRPLAISDLGAGPAFRAADFERIDQVEVRLGQGITGWVAQHGESVRVGDVRRDPRYLVMHDEMRSELCVPLRVGERVVGVLNVESPQQNAFSHADQRLLETVAGQIAAALENARLYSQVRQQVVELERRLALVTAQQEALATTQSEAASLREVDRLKTEFMRTISHELRTPLTLIYGYAELLRHRLSTTGDAAAQRMVDQVYVGSAQLSRLVEDLLDFARTERGELVVHPQQFDLRPLLEEIVAAFQRRDGGGRIGLAEPSGDGLVAAHPVRADRARVAQIVSNLLENALKYAPQGPVLVRASTREGVVRVEVDDQGPGVPPDERDRVWEKFYRGAGIAQLNVAPGSGIGLAVVKALVEAHGGRVGLESAPLSGARFWFELPAWPADCDTPGDG